MTQSNRLNGGLINRGKPLNFNFDGRAYQGYEGDTLASALMANGVRFLGRSFKYHRPRGIFTAGSEEPNALVELRSGARQEPNTRATVAELYEGCLLTELQGQLTLRPACPERFVLGYSERRFLLQDVHVAGGFLGESL